MPLADISKEFDLMHEGESIRSVAFLRGARAADVTDRPQGIGNFRAALAVKSPHRGLLDAMEWPPVAVLGRVRAPLDGHNGGR